MVCGLWKKLPDKIVVKTWDTLQILYMLYIVEDSSFTAECFLLPVVHPGIIMEQPE